MRGLNAGDGRRLLLKYSAAKSKILRQGVEDFTVGSEFPSNLDIAS